MVEKIRRGGGGGRERKTRHIEMGNSGNMKNVVHEKEESSFSIQGTNKYAASV